MFSVSLWIMDFYRKKNLWKLILFLFAACIGAGTLWYTESFLNELRKEEIKKVRQLGDVYKNIINADADKSIPLSESEIIMSNNTIPLIITDEDGNLVAGRNVNEEKLSDPKWLANKLQEMRSEAEPLEIDLENGEIKYLYYQNSILLTKLRLYPVILLIVISLFVIIAYIAFSNSRKAEQNQVWNGLAKETAHQIGTPLTSLVGWIELLRDQPGNEAMVVEMEKDVNRLNTITQRFSKIGSQPSIKRENIIEIIQEAVNYLQTRSPKRIKMSLELPKKSNIPIALNKHLFEWVVENLIRNAIDAIEGKEGQIQIRLMDGPKSIKVEVQDSGKGIPVNKQKTVFRPGFTTKSRGWGLGLSLAKRIIEEYHDGKIFVAQSETGVGTTFRIQLKKDKGE
jgi:signal transduction histidine kinase